MPFNGSGTFTRLYSWTNDAAGGIKIRADRMDNETTGISTGLSNCITKDGQTTITANLPMASFRHTGVGNAASRTDYSSFGQVQDGNTAWADGGGTSDAITASYSIPITTLVNGQMCFVRATAANTTTTPTFSPNGLTARTIVKNGGQALAVGDIRADGHELILRYDLTNTRWELLNPQARVLPFTPASSSSAAFLDFAEDTDNGTNTATIIAPASIASNTSHILPAVSGTLLGTGSTVTVAQGGTGLATLTANNLLIGNGTGNVTFVAPGAANTVLTSNGTTCSFSTPLFSLAFTSSDQVITSAGALTLPHSLGAEPKLVQAYLICQTGELGYTAGDVVLANFGFNDQSMSVRINATNVLIRFGSSAGAFAVTRADTGAGATITNGNWRLRVKAWA
jgi:hypothetical protein